MKPARYALPEKDLETDCRQSGPSERARLHLLLKLSLVALICLNLILTLLLPAFACPVPGSSQTAAAPGLDRTLPATVAPAIAQRPVAGPLNAGFTCLAAAKITTGRFYIWGGRTMHSSLRRT